MPTGYTAKLMEKGQGFREFVMSCARAFGACIEMRDESPDAPIPEEFKPSDYHIKELAEAIKTVAELEAMTATEQIAFGEKKRAEVVRSCRRSLESGRDQNSRLTGMEQRVRAWTAPTSEHRELKAFMLNQIKISKNDIKWSVEYLGKAEAKSAQEYCSDELDAARRHIDYHTEEHEREVHRIKSRNDWIKALRESLKGVA